MKVVLYTRPQCLLCEEALVTLKLVQEDIAFQLEVINIELDDTLHEKYMLMIPVVVCEGQLVQYGQVDYATVYETLMQHAG